MKQYVPLRFAYETGGEKQDFSSGEADGVRRLFTQWFQACLKRREQAEKAYRAFHGLHPPTSDQMVGIARHMLSQDDLQGTIFIYPREIYGTKRNRILDKIQTIFGEETTEGEGVGDRRNLRRKSRRGEMRSDDAMGGTGTRGRNSHKKDTDEDLQDSSGQVIGRTVGKGRERVSNVRCHRHNKTMRKVDKQIHPVGDDR